jgi:hypothetical protein
MCSASRAWPSPDGSAVSEWSSGGAAALATTLQQVLGQGATLPHPRGEPDGDLVEMRRYAPGDPMKWVLWKTFARSRTLMVRAPERALEPATRTLAYMVAGEGDEPAAALLRATLEAGLLGREWRLGSDGSREQAKSADEALPLIVRSRDARPSGGKGLSDFIGRSGDGRSRCLIFAPARLGGWVEPVTNEIRRRRMAFQVILVADGLQRSDELGRVRRVLFRPRPVEEDKSPLAEIEALVVRLRSAGAFVAVLERKTGKLLALPRTVAKVNASDRARARERTA